MIDDQAIQDIVKEILLKEPHLQYSDQIYQFVWRYWEVSANQGKSLSALSPEAFVDLNVNKGTVESIIRARRKVLKEIENEDLSRYLMAQKHYQSYLKK
uniref:Uncharacterized protein n=1 Tax=viral metagenome TaxID=1070528 RepID=A0A6M3Y2C3_9ZZZZ